MPIVDMTTRSAQNVCAVPDSIDDASGGIAAHQTRIPILEWFEGRGKRP